MASTTTLTDMTTATISGSSTTTPRIVTLEEIETITSTPSFQKNLMDAISKGFIAYHAGDFFAAPIQTLGVAPFCFQQHDPDQAGGQQVDKKKNENEYAAQTCVKSGYFRHNPYYVIKVASGGYPMPNNSGLMQVYSQQTGRLLALLLDEGILTEMRTAAVGALAFALFVLPRCATITFCIGMIGTGIQARYQLQWLANVTDCRNLLLYGRSLEKANALKEELEKSGGWIVTIANQADDLLSQCDVIITTTSSRQAILGISCSNTTATTTPGRRRTRLITCIGADAPGKMELDPALVQQAHVLVADCLKQTRERGEFQTWCAVQSTLPTDDTATTTTNINKLFSLGQILAEQNTDLLRNHATTNTEQDDDDNRLYIFDSSGVALQDCVIAQMVYDALLSSSPS